MTIGHQRLCGTRAIVGEYGGIFSRGRGMRGERIVSGVAGSRNGVVWEYGLHEMRRNFCRHGGEGRGSSGSRFLIHHAYLFTLDLKVIILIQV